MDAIRITEVIKELMKLLQNMSKEDDDKLFCKQSRAPPASSQVLKGLTLLNNVEYGVEELKEELGSWFIPDWGIYEGS